MKIIILFLLISVLAGPAVAENVADLFSQYKVDRLYVGKMHPVVLLAKQDRLMRSALKGIAADFDVNFAGHYIMATLPCGTACFSGGVIDAITGKVIWFPFKSLGLTDYWEPISYCRNSRLVRFIGIIDDQKDPTGTYYENRESYYELKDDRFVAVKITSLGEDKGGLVGDGPAWAKKYLSNPAYCTPASETPKIYQGK